MLTHLRQQMFVFAKESGIQMVVKFNGICKIIGFQLFNVHFIFITKTKAAVLAASVPTICRCSYATALLLLLFFLLVDIIFPASGAGATATAGIPPPSAVTSIAAWAPAGISTGAATATPCAA